MSAETSSNPPRSLAASGRQQTCVPRTPDLDSPSGRRAASSTAASIIPAVCAHEHRLETSPAHRCRNCPSLQDSAWPSSVWKEVCRHTNANGQHQTPPWTPPLVMSIGALSNARTHKSQTQFVAESRLSSKRHYTIAISSKNNRQKIVMTAIKGNNIGCSARTGSVFLRGVRDRLHTQIGYVHVN